jgi:pre-rRNA-processing protein IPI1
MYVNKHILFTQVPVSRVLPFFRVLLSYLSCAMTDIHVSIQNDSLAMLDTLLAATPLLIAANADTVLCNFLDMISSLKPDSSSEHALTMNLNSSFTSIAWRMKVLHRLKGLLSALLEYKNQQDRKHSGCFMHPSENIASLCGKSLMFVLFLISFLWKFVNV